MLSAFDPIGQGFLAAPSFRLSHFLRYKKKWGKKKRLFEGGAYTPGILPKASTSGTLGFLTYGTLD